MKGFWFCTLTSIIGLWGLFAQPSNAQANNRRHILIYKMQESEWVYNTYFLSKLGATKPQIDSIESMRMQFVERIFNKADDFIFIADLAKVFEADFEALHRQVATILDEKQLKEIAQLLVAIRSNEDAYFNDEEDFEKFRHLIAETDNQMSIYDYLYLSPEQAVALAKHEYAVRQDDFEGDYDDAMSKARIEVFTAEQMRQYQMYEAKQDSINLAFKMNYARISEEENLDEPEIEPDFEAHLAANEENYFQQRHTYITVSISTLLSYYIPERAMLRTKIENGISDADKATIDGLRARFYDYVKNNPENPFSCPSNEAITQKEKNILQLYAEKDSLNCYEFINYDNQYMEDHLEAFVQSDRTVFNIAKSLATRYDNLIDGVMRENDMLAVNYQVLIQPYTNGCSGPMEREELEESMISPNYQTPDVEYRRNFNFLMVNPAVKAGTQLPEGVTVHGIRVYPTPSGDVQHLDFKTTTDGHVKVDVIAQDGKSLIICQNGFLQKGAHQLSINTQDIPASVYFYRITTAEGVSLVKGMRGE